MNTLHYLLHGCHHKHPMDRWRLVFPPALTTVFVAIILGFLLLVMPYNLALSVFGGGLLGYIVYDLTHYYLHHGVPTVSIPRDMKRYHLNHHFKNQTDSFGISSALWDWIFGTLPQKTASD
eukprot:TRINITY_DN2087_c0_g1_i1.p1 TRINITY_DN2087_c0_g1~~TRINITY_DN2087_c0_g1_i1.p1  ORF type:complete len:121 (+),score=18.40 TRINITY_DN2087_c0_g1_i1:106-468(+)